MLLELLLLVVSFRILPDLHTENIAGTSCLHGFHRLHGLASMLLSAFGRFAQKTPTEQNQIQLPVLHVRLISKRPSPSPASSKAAASRKQAAPQRAFIAFIAFMGAMTTGAGSVQERKEAREIFEVAAARESMLHNSLEAGCSLCARSLTLCTCSLQLQAPPTINLERDMVLASCSHSLTT